MKIKEINKKKVPIVKIDNDLNQFDNKILFPEKLKKANQMLRNTGLPKLNAGKKKTTPSHT